MTDVYITGASMLTAQGVGRKEVFNALYNGVSGLKTLINLSSNSYNAQHAYEIDENFSCTTVGRNSRWLQIVVTEAVNEAGIDLQKERTIVIVGTGLREQESLEKWYRDSKPFKLEQWDYEKCIVEALGAQIPVYTLVNACSASLGGVSLAIDMLNLKQVDSVIVAGVDSIAESMYGLLDRVNISPSDALIPFEQERKGVLMGEGAAAIVLKSRDYFLSNNKKELAKITAAVQNCDAEHETAPSRTSIESLIRKAHQVSKVNCEDIDVVIAHGTGTILNDQTEAEALVETFKERASEVKLSGLKSMTGHTAGASGLIGLISGIEMIHSGKIPPTLGLKTPIYPANQFDVVTDSRTEQVINVVQVNAFGFGGVNAISILEKVE